jgi:hypothetical protein
MTGRRHSRLSKIAHFPTGSSIHTESSFSKRGFRTEVFEQGEPESQVLPLCEETCHHAPRFWQAVSV